MTPAGPPVVELRSVSKTFAGVPALRAVDLTLRAGEVHGLLGQNGCGKSTLIKVLAGYHAPDEGSEVLVRGEAVPLPAAPGDAARWGFTFVHQNLGLAEGLTVAENLGLSRIATGAALRPLDARKLRRWAAELLAEFKLAISPDELLDHLDGTDRALLAIVRAVDQLRGRGPDAGPGLLVLDEPTVFLPRSGVDRLFGLVRDVVATGAAVLFVSHDLDEVRTVTDRVTVLRDGQVVAQAVTGQTTTAELVSLIVGHEVVQGQRAAPDRSGPDRLVLEGASSGRLAPVDLRVRGGEVVGLTGLMGSSYDELVYLLSGARGSFAGRVAIDGAPVPASRWTTGLARRSNIALVPGDRARLGAAGELTVEENVTLPVLDSFTRRGLLDQKRVRARSDELVEEFDVRPRRSDALFATLSGGNQQKAVLGKWLQTEPALLLLHEPTQGVDVGSREDIHALIGSAAEASGMAVLCASTDYNELARLCDRVLVFADDQVIDELSGAALTEGAIARTVLQGSETTTRGEQRHVRDGADRG